MLEKQYFPSTFGDGDLHQGKFFANWAILAARIFFIFVSSLGLPKTTARVESSSSTAEKNAVRRDDGR